MTEVAAALRSLASQQGEHDQEQALNSSNDWWHFPGGQPA